MENRRRHRKNTWAGVVAAMLSLLVAACVQNESDEATRELHLATASLGGVFYPVGQTLSNLVTKYADGQSMLPVVSAGAMLLLQVWLSDIVGAVIVLGLFLFNRSSGALNESP